MSKGTYDDFFDTLGFRESSNRYDVVNIYGSMGRYQMGEASFTDIGLYVPDANPFDNVYGGSFTGKYGVWSVADFLAKPAAQDQAIRDYMALQFTYLKSVWAYDGQTINGVSVTISGMLGGAHLLGWDGAAAWLTSGGDYVPADNFGTTIVEYATLLGGYDTPYSIDHDIAETITGGSGTDSLRGRGGNDVLSGKGGADTLDGGTGNDMIDGGAGTDTALFGAAFDSFTISYDAATDTYTLTSAATGIDTVTGVETFQFSDRTITAANLMAPSDPAPTPLPKASITANTASAAEGNAGATAFTFTVSLSAASAATQTLAWTAWGAGANPADAGSDFASPLTGTLTFAPGETSKTITVLVAGDTLHESNEGFTVTLSGLSSGLEAGTLTASASIANDDVQTSFIGGSGADTLTGGGADDTVSGLGGNDTLYGNGGNDWLDGGTGNDTMYGGLGDDTYLVDSSLDTVSESGGGGTDIVRTTLSAYTLGSDIEALVYTGSGSFAGTGNALANTLTGGSGNDTLNGVGGADRMLGGLGNDIFVFDNLGDVAIEAVNEGTDLVQSSISVSGLIADASKAAMLGANVENVLLVGTAALNATGNALGNAITGNGANNILLGGDGADTLSGAAGNDALVGGDGDDVLIGGIGNDSYSGGLGNDTVSFADITTAVTFSLGAGSGQNTGGAGTDTLVSGHSIENLIGGSGADKLTGDAAANRVDGGSGSDIINGGLGNDVLMGGAGTDFFVFNTTLGNSNVDVIEGFNTADDTIRLENSGIFSALRSTGRLASGAFVSGTAALQSDDRIIYNPVNGGLYYDADGSGSGKMIQFATLTNLAGSLTAADFIII